MIERCRFWLRRFFQTPPPRLSACPLSISPNASLNSESQIQALLAASANRRVLNNLSFMEVPSQKHTTQWYRLKVEHAVPHRRSLPTSAKKPLFPGRLNQRFHTRNYPDKKNAPSQKNQAGGAAYAARRFRKLGSNGDALAALHLSGAHPRKGAGKPQQHFVDVGFADIQRRGKAQAVRL